MSPEVAEIERMPLTEGDGVGGVDGGNEKGEKIFETKVVLRGKEFTLCYDWASQVKAEELTGVNLLIPTLSSRWYRAVVLARLLKYHPETTLQDVELLIPGNMSKISDAMSLIGEPKEPE